jgi:hypothetical protein
MLPVRPKILEYEQNQEHILRRLGGAVVVQWDGLPQDVRDLLLRQATVMFDREPAVQLGWQIEEFINVKGGKSGCAGDGPGRRA